LKSQVVAAVADRCVCGALCSRLASGSWSAVLWTPVNWTGVYGPISRMLF